ncbi:small ubiquitin-related modifier 2-A [Phlyctochytrium arcticum]|nr:small ubiquitin-related modifier 2-A [Phlyctochytrium arcticum]
MADNNDAPQEERKPETVQHINLKVLGHDQTEIAFKIKRTTPLQRLMDAYVSKTGQDKTSVRFLYDGNRINGHETPDELEMEDNDMIQVTVQQLGGSF